MLNQVEKKTFPELCCLDEAVENKNKPIPPACVVLYLDFQGRKIFELTLVLLRDSLLNNHYLERKKY